MKAATLSTARPAWRVPAWVWPALAAMGIVLLFWLLLPGDLRADDGSDYGAFYEPVARNLLAGHGLILPGGSAATRYPPGYPLVLAAGFGLAQALHLPEDLVQDALVLLCMAVSTVALWTVAGDLWGRRAAWVVALGWASYPFLLWLTKQPSSEIPFVALFYSGLALAWRSRQTARLPGEETRAALLAGAAGALLGGAMLVRPIAVGVGVLVAVLLYGGSRPASRRTRLVLAGALLLGNLLVVGPWEGWLASQTGSLAPLSTGGAASMRDGLTFAANSKGYRETIAVPADVRALMLTIRERDDLDSPGRIGGFLAQQATRQPGTVATLFLLKAARSWFGTDSGRSEGISLLVQLVYLLAAVVAMGCIWWRGWGRSLLPVLLLVGYFWLMTISALSILRYMVPVMGLLILLLPGILVRPLPATAAPGPES